MVKEWQWLTSIVVLIVVNIVGFAYNYARVTERVDNLKENINLRVNELEKMVSERIDRVQGDIRELRMMICRSNARNNK